MSPANNTENVTSASTPTTTADTQSGTSPTTESTTTTTTNNTDRTDQRSDGSRNRPNDRANRSSNSGTVDKSFNGKEPSIGSVLGLRSEKIEKNQHSISFVSTYLISLSELLMKLLT